MYWGDKMDMVIKDVLGEDYYLLIKSNTSFQIMLAGECIANRESKYMLRDHWREQLRDTLEIIQKQKIQKALNKV